MVTSRCPYPFISLFLLTLYFLLSLSPSSLHASTLQVGSKPSGVAVNTATNKAIITNQKDNTISVVDLTNSKDVFSLTNPFITPGRRVSS